MTNKEKDLIVRSNELISDITTYIDSNPDWIYYFLNPLAGGNDELFDCMKEHPNDWEYYIDFEIYNIIGSSVKIKIHIDDYTDCGIVISRYINLINFEETVKRNKMNYRGKTYKTMGEVFNEALRLAKTDSYEAKEFFKEYVNWISIQNHYSWDKAIEIAKSNFGYFAGYYDEETCDIIYKTYQCSHPIFGDKPFDVSPEEAYQKGLERGHELSNQYR